MSLVVIEKYAFFRLVPAGMRGRNLSRLSLYGSVRARDQIALVPLIHAWVYLYTSDIAEVLATQLPSLDITRPGLQFPHASRFNP